MYKDKEKQRAANKERQRRYREGWKEAKSVTISEGVTALESQGVTSSGGFIGVTYPDIIDKLTDPVWRGKLERICSSFSRRGDMEVCWLGDNNLTVVCDWLECTG